MNGIFKAVVDPCNNLVSNEISSKVYDKVQEVVDAKVEKAIRDNARPKVVGSISKDKLSRLDIKISVQSTALYTIMWVEQYGLRISEKININELIESYVSSSINTGK